MRDHQPPRRRVNLVGCALLAGLICLAFAVVLGWVATANVRTARAPEPPFPAGVPRDVPLFAGSAAADQDEYLLPEGPDNEVTVEFDEVLSFQGLWSGADPYLRVSEPYSQTLTALTKVDTWRNLEVGHGPGNEYWTPWVRATLPVGESLRHQWLTVTAGVTLTYPLATGLEVADTSAELSRTLRLFVISPAELAQVEAHIRWQDARDTGPAETAALVLCPGVLLIGAVAGFVAALRAYQMKKEDEGEE